MTGAIKFVLEYDKQFWRKEGYSGMLYSHAGIIVEMYNHTNFKEDKFGFTGFLNDGAISYHQDVRKEFVLKQLCELFSEKALKYLFYDDKIWNDEFIIVGIQIIHRPHQNNGHHLLNETYFNRRLFFCGSETSDEYGGYVEGAVNASNRIFTDLNIVHFNE
jgi:monoamine oxidase